MGIREISNTIPGQSGSGLGQSSNTIETFGSQSTGTPAVFGRQTDTGFGNFANQNNGTTNHFSGTSTQPTFGSSFFQNQGLFQPYHRGYFHSTPQYTTDICFTGFGRAKPDYFFKNAPNACTKKVIIHFLYADSIFGANIEDNVESIVEIEAQPTNSVISWTPNSNDFSFGVNRLENYNASFFVKSSRPMKFSVKFLPASILTSLIPKKREMRNRKITLIFRLDPQHYLRPSTVIVEFSINFDNVSTEWNDCLFSVGQIEFCDTLEVKTSKNAIFKITFSEDNKFNIPQPFGNQISGNGRQMNSFPSSSGLLFGQSTSAFGSNQSCENSSVFGGNQLFGNATTGFGTMASDQNRQTTTRGSLFGQTNNPINGQPAINIGNGEYFEFGANPKSRKLNQQYLPCSTVEFGAKQPFGSDRQSDPTLGNDNSNVSAFGFGASQTFGKSKTQNDQGQPTTLSSLSGQSTLGFGQNSSANYQPIEGSDVIANGSGPLHVITKTHCITAMNEYADKSLEELRMENYSSPLRGMARCCGKADEFNPHRSQNYYFSDTHQPFLNQNQLNSNNEVNNQNATTRSLFTTNQPTNSFNLQNSHQAASEPNQNMTINEFYNDVFKYLDYIQNQYRHLEKALIDKNSVNPFENNTNKSPTFKLDEKCKSSIQHRTKTLVSTTESTGFVANKRFGGNNSFENDIARCFPKKYRAFQQAFGSTTLNTNAGLLFGSASSDKTEQTKQKLPSTKLFGAADKNEPNFFKLPVGSMFLADAVNAGVKLAETNKSSVVEKATQAGETSAVIITPNAKINVGSISSKDCEKMDDSNEKVIISNSEVTPSTSSAVLETKADNTFSGFSSFSNKDSNKVPSTGSFSSTLSTNKPVDLNEIKSINEFQSGVFKYLDYIQSQYRHLEKTLNDKNMWKVSENHPSKSASPSSNEATKNSTQNIEKLSTPGSTCFGENNCVINQDSKNNNSPASFNVTSKPYTTEQLAFKPPPQSLFIPIEMPTNDKTKSQEVKQPDTIETNSQSIFSFKISNDKPSNITVNPLFLTKTLSKPDDSYEKTILSSTSIDGKPGTIFNISQPGANELSKDVFPITLLGNDNLSVKKFSNAIPASTHPFCLFNKSNDNAKAVISNSEVLTSKVEESLQKETNNEVKPSDLVISSAEQKDAQDGFVFTFHPKNTHASKMRKISEELAALVVDGSEDETNRKNSLTKSDTGSDISNYSLVSNQSLNETTGQGNQSSDHPYGMVMKRYGYYTLPSLEELGYQSLSEGGRCLVPNFVVGRKGYGKICFQTEINAVGLNVDDIVHFRNKEVIIYPNENSQSDHNYDLDDCEVLITLEQVWPHDKTNHELIKDPLRLLDMKYEDKLRLVCHKNDIHFVEYCPKTGNWVFKMNQLKKITINCWDEEDEDAIVFKKK